MAISMLKIRRPLGRLIFNMEIAIPGKTAPDYSNASEVTVTNMGKHKFSKNLLCYHNKTKHDTTVCMLYGTWYIKLGMFSRHLHG